jgi:Protein of unknown function (DUF998)
LLVRHGSARTISRYVREPNLLPVATLRRVTLLAGVAAPVVWLGLIAWGDLSRADIRAVTDFISELGERGSATEAVFRYGGFVFTGVLYLCVAAGLWVVESPRWKAAVVALFVALDGIGRVGAGVYPCDPGCEGASCDQTLHGLFATIGFCSGILAALAAGLLYRRRIDLLLGLATTIFLLLMTWEDNPIHAEGLWERLATGALSVWMLIFTTGVVRWRNERQG